MKKTHLKESEIINLVHRIILEDESKSTEFWNQETSYIDSDTGKTVASTEMLDNLGVKIDANTQILQTILSKITNLEENLGRRWT